MKITDVKTEHVGTINRFQCEIGTDDGRVVVFYLGERGVRRASHRAHQSDVDQKLSDDDFRFLHRRACQEISLLRRRLR